MGNINAFGKRNFFKIFIRKFAYLAFRMIKKLYPSKGVGDKIVFYKATSTQEFADFTAKLRWYIPDAETLKVTSIIVEDNYTSIKPSSFLSQELVNAEKINILCKDKINLNHVFNEASIILVSKFSLLFNFAILKNLGKVHIVDPYFFSYVESITWQDLYYNSLPETVKAQYVNITKENFRNLDNKAQNHNSAVCFVTGPSFDTYKNYDFSKFDFKLICNSIVKNGEFLEFIGGPDILVFADPVFHFGASKYAESFRSCVLEVVRKYKCFVFVPIKALPLMLNRADDLKEYFIGIDYDKHSFNFPTPENLYVKDNANILTNLLIPLASSFATSISIFGADGRNKNEKYFWNHSKTAQFNDLMDSTFETHPSFFRDRDYSDYYDQHCKTVQELLEYGEAKGKKYFSLTPSFIPAFHKREVQS